MRSLLTDDTNNVLVPVDVIVLIVEFQVSAAITRNDDEITDLSGQCQELALRGPSAGSHSFYNSLIHLLLSRIGEQNAACCFDICLDFLDQDPVGKGHESLESLGHCDLL